jgi:hypothetical protein
LQIKGRCLLPGSKPGQRLGSIDITKDWDAVLMVLLDENFDALEIYEAERPDIIKALSAPGSKLFAFAFFAAVVFVACVDVARISVFIEDLPLSMLRYPSKRVGALL